MWIGVIALLATEGKSLIALGKEKVLSEKLLGRGGGGSASRELTLLFIEGTPGTRMVRGGARGTPVSGEEGRRQYPHSLSEGGQCFSK